MSFDSFGTLTVQITGAGGAIPIKGAIVKVKGTSEENSFINYSVLTDSDGASKKLSLPAPISLYSLSPNAAELPYGVYDIEISAPNFLTKKIHNVTIFSDINTYLPVNMIPAGIHSNSTPTPLYILDTVIPENSLTQGD